MEFNKAYNRQEFMNFLQNSFLPNDFLPIEEDVVFSTQTKYSTEAIKLGSSETLDLVVYEIKHTSQHDARVALSKEAFRMLADEWQSRALVLFIPQDKPQNYRFSLIEIKLEGKADSAKIERKYSNPRRYSYLFGEGIGGFTPNKYLIGKGRVTDEKDLTERFSVEVLAKAFYGELSDWYAWAIDTVEFPGEQEMNTPEKRIEHRSKNVIRLLTRLLFVWFLRHKNLIPQELFDEEYLKQNLLKEFEPNLQIGLFNYKSKDSIYYKAILQNLFFATLNCPITPQSTEDKRERGFRKDDWYGQGFGQDHLMRYKELFSNPDAFIVLVNQRVPFLNGGLFDCLDNKQEKAYVDGFSDNLLAPNKLIVPDYLFFGEVGKGQDLSEFYGDKKKKSTNVYALLDILKKYNFTIEENTPYDVEVSLDPELLGKVFENLLASYNPETKTTARKQTGSFYTPREIVQYMVDESLVAHLKCTVGESLEPQFRKLMQYTDEELQLTSEQKKAIIQSIQNCKVLDPACGSGAFPVGILQQMVHILSQLDEKNEIWKDLILEDSIHELTTTLKDCTQEERTEIQDDINRSFDNSINSPDYARKLYLIENCIYGVDIQSIAVQISKLRFFISLVVDQKPTTNAADNFGIRPLPNLEAKFVAANTLIGLKKSERNLFDNREVEKLQQKLIQASHRIFGAKTNKTKNRYKARVEELQAEIADALLKHGDIGNDDARLMKQWRMFDQNVSSPFFDPEYMFGVSGGFDIVIGNPPYVQLQANGGELAEPLKNLGYETFARTGDIYCVFYEQGVRLLKDGAHLIYITSNKWMRAGYGEATRNFFATKTNPIQLIDFAGVKIFESATVDTNILLLQKSKNKKQTLACVAKGTECRNNLSDYIRQNGATCSFNVSDSWVVLSEIEQSIKAKIEAVGTPLKDWDINIYRGVLTGCNEAFIISGTKKNEILSNCQTEEERLKTAELIRPILRGKDIKRYGYEFADLYLIATFPSKHYNIEDYPAVRDYLLAFGKERIEQTGKEYLINGERIKSRKRTNNKWFETQDSISYWEDFSKQKIVFQEIVQESQFALDSEANFFCNDTCRIITGNDLEYILCVLNSPLFFYAIKRFYGGGALGEKGIRMKHTFFINFPCINPNQADKAKLLDLLQKKQTKEIDSLIFEIYGLTQEQVGFIEIK
ncbi:MAG: Eco57I restriction-modification methylase domain-containing protein [Phocaeicola sp.]